MSLLLPMYGVLGVAVCKLVFKMGHRRLLQLLQLCFSGEIAMDT